jgi:hypothetical protein
MFLKFCWSIGLSFSLFILLFLFAFQGGLEVPSIKPSPTVHGAQLPLSVTVTACHSCRCPVPLRTNYMSFSQSRALEAGFDAGLGPRHFELDLWLFHFKFEGGKDS